MAKKLSVDLELNAQGFKQGINEAKNATADYKNETRDLKRETDEYLKDFGSLRKQFAAAKKEAQNLAVQFANLGEAEKKSEYGQELAESLNIAIQKAAELQDVMSDTNQAIKRTASDTQGWDALKDGLSIGKDLATMYAGAVAKLTGNEKALKDMVATVAMVQGAANAVVKIGNALQKQSNLLITINNVQLKAKAIAEELATKKTIAATVAQKAFNAVAKANPYVLLASVLLTAATAIGTYMFATKNATEADEEAKEEAEKLAEARKAETDAYKNAITGTLPLYRKLQVEWKNLRNEGEKIQWIKDNQTGFKQLGLQINNVDDAERILIKNTGVVVQAFKKRAEAAAYAARIQNLYTKKLEEEDKILEIQAKYEKKRADLRPQMNVSMDDQLYRLKQKENDEILEVRKKQHEINKQINAATETEVKLLGEAEDLTKKINGEKKKDLDNTKEKVKNTKPEMEVKMTFPDTKKLAQDFKTKFEQQLKKNPIELQFKEDKKFVNNVFSQPQREQEINNILKKTLNFGEVESPDYEKILDIDKFEKEGNKLIGKRDEIIKQISYINKTYGDTAEGVAAMETLEVEYGKVINRLDELKDKADQIELNNLKFEGFKEGIDTLGNLNGALSGIASTWKSLSEDWEDMSPFEKMTAAFDAVISTISTVIQAYESVNNVIKLFGEISELSAAKKIAANSAEAASDTVLTTTEVTNSGLKTAANETEKASDIGKLGVKEAGAIAGATEAGSSLPFPANLAAIAAGIAAVVAAFTMVFSCFEQGGIVPGNKFFGDNVLARVNSGEMILNTHQQKRLFNMLDGVESANGGRMQISSVRVQGRDLLLCLNNELKSTKKSPIK